MTSGRFSGKNSFLTNRERGGKQFLERNYTASMIM
jgi:hypothetical protein